MTQRPRLRLGLSALALLPLGAQAQAADGALPDAKDATQLEAVVVSATKRPQALQKTPIAISVIGGRTLEAMNLNNLSSITAQLPTVNYRANASNKDAALFIRGVGTISTSPGVEPTVAVVMDGVVSARPGQATMDLLEVERIEVLRGPQGTLFGKNASAGVIHIVTRAPQAGFGGFVDLSAYQGGEKRVRLGLQGGSQQAKGSLSLMSAKYDGNITNVFDGSKVNGHDRQGLRARVDLAPMRDLKAVLIADHTQSKDTTPTGVPYDTNVRTYPSNAVTANPLYLAAVFPVVPSPTNRQINSEMSTRVDDQNSGLSAQWDYSLPSLVLTAITAQRRWQNHQFQDQDRLSTVYRQFAQTADQGELKFKQFTQELRVASTGPQTLDYVAGLYYFKTQNDEQYRRDVTRCPSSTATALPSGLVPCSAGSVATDNGVATYGIKNTSKAAFGEGTLHLSDALRVTLGLRYTDDTLRYHHGRVASNTGVPGVGATRSPVAGSTKEQAWSGRFGPQFDWAPNLMGYATYSRGYKGPAYNVFFNMGPTQDNVLAPEKSQSIELGVKSELLDRRLRLNLAVFDTQYKGYQANVPDLVNGSIVTRLINAGAVRTQGVELDASAQLGAGLTVNASIAHTMARVKHFNCPPGAAASCDINGKPLPYAPDWKASLRIQYHHALRDGLTLDWGLDAAWQTRTQFDLQQQPNSVQPAYAIFNARVALQSDGGWSVALIGRNLGDKPYATLVQNAGAHINRYVPRDDQRYLGLNLRHDF